MTSSQVLNSSQPTGPATSNPDTPKLIGELLKDAAEHAGEFTFGGPASELPSIPGLQVEGFGPVTVPLMDEGQADRLAACGRMAPFGLGCETVLDPAVRRTWQFDASQVKVINPAWDHGLAHLMATVATRLGCPDMPLECHLYKLLLYGPGCHFVRHRDTEKEDRMFATLVIQLPSAHQGGKLIVYQPDGTAVSHDFGAADGTSEFAAHYALHYADAEHELKPVTAGYRLALVYSICWPEGHLQVDLLQSLTAQRHLAGHLATLSKNRKSFFYMFEHQYTPASIGQLKLKALKGNDRARATMVQAANGLLSDASGFSLYLVQGTRDVDSGPDQHVDSQVYGLWVDVRSGRQYESAQKDTDLGVLINPDSKTLQALWSVEKRRISKEYTGNEGYQIHNRYGCYILVGIPKSLGPYGLLPYIGCAAITQLLDIDSCSAADMDHLLSSLPESCKKSMPISQHRLTNDRSFDFYNGLHMLPSTKDDFPAQLLESIVRRSLVQCIPTFFAVMSDPLSPAMVPAYVQAVRTPQLWSVVEPLLCANLPRAQEPFMLGLKLVCDALVEAQVPQDDDTMRAILAVLGTCPTPSHFLTSMPSIFVRAATLPHVWDTVHGPVVSALLAAVARNQAYFQSTDRAMARDLVFKVALSIVVRVADGGGNGVQVAELLDVLAKCDIQSPVYEYMEPVGYDIMPARRYGEPSAEDKISSLLLRSRDDFKLATHSDAVWQVVLPMVCGWFKQPKVNVNRFSFALLTVTELFHHRETMLLSAPEVLDEQLWHPLLDAAMASADFLSSTSAHDENVPYYLRNDPGQQPRVGVPTLVARAMRYESLWTYISDRFAAALQVHNSRFTLGVQVLKKAFADTSVPHARWLPMIPMVFSSVPSPAGTDTNDVQDQMALWSVALASDNSSVIQRLVNAYVQARNPSQLKGPVAAVTALLAQGPSPHAPLFLALLESRLAYVQSVLPPPDGSIPLPWAIPNATYPRAPFLENYLRDNQEALTLRGFESRADAKWFVNQHSMPPAEVGRHIWVTVNKVDRWDYEIEYRKAPADGYRWTETDEEKVQQLREEVKVIEDAIQSVREEGSSPANEEGAGEQR